MSRAFVKEDIEIPERTLCQRSASGLPPGALNLMTSSGAELLRTRLATLKQATHSNAEEISDLDEILASATIVEAHPRSDDIVFGSRVTLRNTADQLETYHIVGVDEVSLEPGNVSWVSPLGKALLAARLGQSIPLPSGSNVLGTVVQVE